MLGLKVGTEHIEGVTWEAMGKYLYLLTRWCNEAHHAEIIVGLLLMISGYIWGWRHKKQIKVTGTFSDKEFMPELKQEVTGGCD